MRAQRGWVLIYTLWVLAAVAATLAGVTVMGRSAVKVPESQLRAAIEGREIYGVLDYVLRYTQDFDPRVDPRYAAYRKIMEENRDSLVQSDDALALLKALLEQLQWSLEIGDRKKGSKDADKKDKTIEDKDAEDRASLTRQSRQFFARKEPYAVNLGERSYEVRLSPANALPNLNLLEREPLERYLRYLGLTERGAIALAAVVIDWRDADEFTGDGGAETGYYSSLREPYAPRNAPIRSWREVAYLKGMTPEVLRLLRDNFTLVSQDAYAHVDYLPPAAIAALADLPPQVAQDAVENYRAALEASDEKPLVMPKIVTEGDQQKFLLATASTLDERQVRITIKGQQVRLVAVFDLSKRVVVDYWGD